MDKTIINKIFEIFKASNANPKTELFYTNDFTFLIAIILSAQSTDKRVNIITNELFKIITSPKDVLSLGNENLEYIIKSIGLFHNKAKNITELSKILIEKYNGNIPDNYDDILQLPGVGRKTANVFVNNTRKDPKIAVDTHVFRVANRLGIVSGNTPVEVEQKLYNNVDKKYHINLSNWLVLHGRYICKAKSPECNKCLLNEYCNYYNK